MYKLKYLLLILFLLPLVSATNSTNCTIINASDVWLNISLLPSEIKTAHIDNCHYNLNCSSCTNETSSSICRVSRNIEAGDDYSLKSGSCDINFSCEYKELACENDNITKYVDIKLSRENTSDLFIDIQGKRESFPLSLREFSYVYPAEIICPDSECIGEELNASYTYEKCQEFLPRLMDDNVRWDFYSTSFKTWANNLNDISNKGSSCTDKLAVCIASKDNLINKNNCTDSNIHADLKDRYDTLKITSTIMKVSLWIETPLLIILFIIMIIILIKMGVF